MFNGFLSNVVIIYDSDDGQGQRLVNLYIANKSIISKHTLSYSKKFLID